MKHSAVAYAAILVIVTSALNAQTVDIVYVDGVVDVKYPDGELVEAFIGDQVQNGDVVITGKDGLADLEPGNGSVIRISSDTVFTVREVELGGEKRTVLSTALGSVKFKFDRFTGQEPLLGTPSMIAGIRGTELEIFAGSDGSTLVVVETGRVDVQSKGVLVSLNAEEGVEVTPGEPPGEKFTVLRGQLDFSSWNGERQAKMLADPLAAIEGMANGLETLIEEIEALVPEFEASVARLEAADKRRREIEDAEARRKFYAETVFPLEIETSYIALNIRYYALSALSYRRYVLGTMYVSIRTRTLQNGNLAEFSDFFDAYDRIIKRFDQAVSEHLVEADI